MFNAPQLRPDNLDCQPILAKFKEGEQLPMSAAMDIYNASKAHQGLFAHLLAQRLAAAGSRVKAFS